ncbi:MAG: AMP-binding protein [Geminocystis sp.]|nr:AMP-binding protein [Geminocystis sp.]MCS7146751.1 AMP-binding protein [Geminocystis sp.]MDW8115577.1 AMP-binding protein [Geminocystis sp.]MDW8463118.1 AMP-binding protein [Geminocystis sp.]
MLESYSYALYLAMLAFDFIYQRLSELRDRWFFFGRENGEILELFKVYLDLVNERYKEGKSPIIFLGEKKTEKFVSAFLASIAGRGCLFLINPLWQKQEWQQLKTIAKPDIVLGTIPQNFDQGDMPEENCPRIAGVMIPTGGTSGRIKFAIHTWDTLVNSALAFYHYFGCKTINYFVCLPLYHVSGLMPFIRSFTTGGRLFFYPFGLLKKGEYPRENFSGFYISLVPTQLNFFLENNPDFLKQFKAILVGGAPLTNEQMFLARKHALPLAPTYGMTETAGGITILKPEEFASNNKSSGKPLPHAKITTENGVIKVESTSLFKGYYPHYKPQHVFVTDDVGHLDSEGYLHVLGRNSFKIISGGENIFPQEVEEVILATNLVEDVAVKGVKHPYWGEIVACFYVPKNETITAEQIRLRIQGEISSYKIPKIWEKREFIPRNDQGKINYNHPSLTVYYGSN